VPFADYFPCLFANKNNLQGTNKRNYLKLSPVVKQAVNVFPQRRHSFPKQRVLWLLGVKHSFLFLKNLPFSPICIHIWQMKPLHTRGIDVSTRKSNVSDSMIGNSDFSSMEHFNAVQTAVVMIDSQCRVLFVNTATKRLLEHEDRFSHAGLTCHQMIHGQETPCNGCLLQPSPSPAGPKSHGIQNQSGRELFVKEELFCFSGYNMLIFFDVTREIAALRKLDLTHKELKAKTVLLERRRYVAADEKGRIQRMFNQLPDAFVQVNDGYMICNKNEAVSKILPLESGEFCYSLLGKESPCPECPAQQGFERAGGRKISHQVGGRFLTEHIVQGSGEGGGLLLFSDTTRQIQLIERIREQQDTITRKNDILSNLVSLQTRMQKASVSSEMINYFMDVFLPICRAEEALVIIDDIRPGCVWLVVNRGVDELQLTQIVRRYLSREVQGMDRRKISEELLPWEKTYQMELVGGNGRKVGMMLFPKSDTVGEGDLVPLFSEPFGAFIHNQLLLRQLEEKANTDPLTGLYNRGYMDDALAAEKKKSDAFGISYSVIMVDVNRLKQANDIYGHETGDRLILCVSERLNAVVRKTDLVARIGGDEFLILLPDTAEEGASILEERFLRDVFQDVTIEVGDNKTFPVTVSLGSAGSDRVPHEALVKTADRRMYEAKETYYQTHERYR
jgi:diguanylate cyclase (GGDEF)-like protein